MKHKDEWPSCAYAQIARYKNMLTQRSEQLLHNIANVQFASMYNVATFTRQTADSLQGSLKEPRRLFKQLRDAELITNIPLYGFGRKFAHNTFYRLTLKGHKFIEAGKYRYIKPKSIDGIYHESAKIDLALAFIHCYPDYKVEIDYNKIIGIKKNDNYNPDIHVRITSPEDKVYDFLVEIERTRDWSQIRKEKLNRNEKILNFKNHGLSEKTKLLYVYTHERFNVFLRPVEYREKQDSLLMAEKSFWGFKKYSKGLSVHKYLFMPLHSFYRLNDAVWCDSSGQIKKLINN